MDRHDLIVGGIALIAGVLLGLLFAPRGASVEDIQNALEERLAAVESAASGTGEGISALQAHVDDQVSALQTQVEESVSSLQSEFGALGDRLGSVETAVSDTADSQASMAEKLSSELSGRFESLGSAISDQSSALESRLEGFRQSIASGLGASDEADEPAAESEAAAESQDEAPAAAAPATADFVGIGAGETAVFGGGALRAFVSRVASGEARLSVNGETQMMKPGDTITVTGQDGTECRLMLSDMQGSQVALNAACGDELQEPQGATPGNVMALGDGSVRVFVSGIADDGSTARIAVNGVQTETVAVGESVDVMVEDQSCQVTVDGIDRGHVALSTNCGS